MFLIEDELDSHMFRISIYHSHDTSSVRRTAFKRQLTNVFHGKNGAAEVRKEHSWHMIKSKVREREIYFKALQRMIQIKDSLGHEIQDRRFPGEWGGSPRPSQSR